MTFCRSQRYVRRRRPRVSGSLDNVRRGVTTPRRLRAGPTVANFFIIIIFFQPLACVLSVFFFVFVVFYDSGNRSAHESVPFHTFGAIRRCSAEESARAKDRGGRGEGKFTTTSSHRGTTPTTSNDDNWTSTPQQQ